ncbi:hypothetical protein DL764_007763 [Monosporascus ibericus]|uniref:Uncharacterized protein n=1 Tax=Monosporascus ibericus TaxID=155417 RepID=A0A4Q4T209_9PEZI|nr:hypothetical protein DL764_007763 [Monosporascus ibericus]
MHDHIHGSPLVYPPEVVGHQFCSRCKVLIKCCSFGLDCPSRAFIDDKLCRYCADNAHLLEGEDDEAFENDVAAYTRFHLHTAHLLNDAQRVRAGRAGLKPWQLRELRRMRRTENSAVEEARVKEGCRDTWPLPGLGAPSDSVDYETACYEMETRIYKQVTEKEEELLEDWNDRRLQMGVVEPRPALTWVIAMGDNQRPVWELDKLPPKQPPLSPAPHGLAPFIPGLSLDTEDSMIYPQYGSTVFQEMATKGLDAVYGSLTLPLEPADPVIYQQHEGIIVQEGAIREFQMDYANPSLPPEPADSILYQGDATEAFDMGYGNQLLAPLPTDDILLPRDMDAAASFLHARDDILSITPCYSAILNSVDEISSLETCVDAFRWGEQGLHMEFDAGLDKEPVLRHNESDDAHCLSLASDIVG